MKFGSAASKPPSGATRPENGQPRYNVAFARLYKDGDTWMSTRGFGRSDLLVLAKVADLAHTRVCELPPGVQQRGRVTAPGAVEPVYTASPLSFVRLDASASVPRCRSAASAAVSASRTSAGRRRFYPAESVSTGAIRDGDG